VSRDTRPGDSVARVSVCDADTSDELKVELYHHWPRGGSNHSSTFHLTTHGDGVYILTVARPLTEQWYRLKIVATDSGSLATSKYLDVFVPDRLTLSQTIYRASLSTDTLPGTCVTQLQVTGDHSKSITYQRLDKDELVDVFYVRRTTGRVCTRSWLPCDSPSIVRLVVMVTDLSSQRSTAVAVELRVTRSLSDQQKHVFYSGFYSVDVEENVPLGHCLLTVCLIIIIIIIIINVKTVYIQVL